MKWRKWCVAAIVVFAIVHTAYMVRSCKMRMDYPKLKEQVEAYKVQVTELEQRNSELDVVIAESQALIASRDQTISTLRQQNTVSEQAIANRDASLEELNAQLATETDKDKIIVNLKSQLVIWSDKFSLAQNIIENQKKEIAEWELKFNTQVTISEAWKAKYENEFTLRKASEALNVGYENQLKKDKFWVAVGKWGVPIAAGIGLIF